MPIETQQNIYRYLNYESIFSFKKACKSSYFLHKNIQTKQDNLLYVVGLSLHVVQTLEIFLYKSSSFKAISEDEIVASLNKKGGAETRLLAFHSLYHALEYSYAMAMLMSSYDGRCDSMASIWAVRYLYNLADLTFSQLDSQINERFNSYVYALQSRSLCIASTSILKKDIEPILGAVIFPCSDFGKYKILNLVDFVEFQKRNNAQNRNEKNRNECITM